MPSIVLIHPDIPQNLGGILRLSACLNLPIHVIEPCGFPLDNARLRRSGMDYIAHATLHRHASWEHFKQHKQNAPLLPIEDTSHSRDRGDTQCGRGDSDPKGRWTRSEAESPKGELRQNEANQLQEEGGVNTKGERGPASAVSETNIIRPLPAPSAGRNSLSARNVLIETDGTATLGDFTFQPNDYLILGSESAGTPRHLYPEMDVTLRIPMRETMRSFNVAMTAGIAAFEAYRQLRWPL